MGGFKRQSETGITTLRIGEKQTKTIHTILTIEHKQNYSYIQTILRIEHKQTETTCIQYYELSISKLKLRTYNTNNWRQAN
jgi:hypothetical protein